jgi:hypothetical protein
MPQLRGNEPILGLNSVESDWSGRKLRISYGFKVHEDPSEKVISIVPEKDPQYTIPTTFSRDSERVSPLPFLT